MAERERKRLATRNSTYRASLIAGVEEPGMFGESLLGKSRGQRGQRRAARSRTYSSSGSEGETLG
mgnify:CR=1 FL=1